MSAIVVKPKTLLDRILYSVSRGLAVIGAVALVIMMLVTVVDVCGRYFFNKPVVGGWELTGLLLVWAAMFGIAYCQIEKSHIRVSFLLERFPRRMQNIIDSLAYLIGGVGFFLISWQSFVSTKGLILAGDGGLSSTMHIVLWPFRGALAVGAAMAAIILLVDFIKYMTKAVKK
jgi:TRAP-type transport system small permease protein